MGKIPGRRKWQPTPVFLSGKLHGQWSLAGYSPWGHKETTVTDHKCTSLTNYVSHLTKQSAKLVMFRKVKAHLYAAPAPSSQPLTPPLPATLNSATKDVHGVISRLVHPQTGLREFPHLLARVETPAGYVPRSGAARGLMGERSSVWVLAASSSYSSTLLLSKQQKKRTRATAKPTPLGLLLPSAAFFPLDLGSLLQTPARDPGTQLTTSAGGQVACPAPCPSARRNPGA